MSILKIRHFQKRPIRHSRFSAQTTAPLKFGSKLKYVQVRVLVHVIGSMLKNNLVGMSGKVIKCFCTCGGAYSDACQIKNVETSFSNLC